MTTLLFVAIVNAALAAVLFGRYADEGHPFSLAAGVFCALSVFILLALFLAGER